MAALAWLHVALFAFGSQTKPGRADRGKEHGFRVPHDLLAQLIKSDRFLADRM